MPYAENTLPAIILPPSVFHCSRQALWVQPFSLPSESTFCTIGSQLKVWLITPEHMLKLLSINAHSDKILYGLLHSLWTAEVSLSTAYLKFFFKQIFKICMQIL